MNQILEGAPLSYFQSNQKPQYVENDKMKVQENLNQIQNGIIPGVTHGFTDIIDTSPQSYPTTEILAIRGNYERTPLSSSYFSQENIQSIQQSIRYYVYKQTGKVIDTQSENEIYIIMRSFLFQNGDQTAQGPDIQTEIERLNHYTIQFSVDKIVSEINLYDKYTDELENLRVPIDMPKYQDGKVNQLGHPYV